MKCDLCDKTDVRLVLKLGEQEQDWTWLCINHNPFNKPLCEDAATDQVIEIYRQACESKHNITFGREAMHSVLKRLEKVEKEYEIYKATIFAETLSSKEEGDLL